MAVLVKLFIITVVKKVSMVKKKYHMTLNTMFSVLHQKVLTKDMLNMLILITQRLTNNIHCNLTAFEALKG